MTIVVRIRWDVTINTSMTVETETKAPHSVLDRFGQVLKIVGEREATHLHISVGGGFRMRIEGKLVPVPESGPLSPAELASIAAGILLAGRKCTREQLPQFIENLTEYDCSYSVPALGRYRVNISSQRRSLSIVLRHIPYKLPTIDGLGLPRVVTDIAMTERGLVLVTGIAGSGKSTTLAAMIGLINRTKYCKIITIEDPIEFLYKDERCTIAQRECGSDTESFTKALRAALRQDPDVILVGEMRDKETIDIAIKAAETGHLVLSTVHTTDAPKTISRIVSAFDPAEQYVVRLRLAEALKAIISQRLLRRADGRGRVVACEIMRQTKSIQECIADPAKLDSMMDFIKKDRELYGMQTFDQHLIELYRKKIIDLDTAKAAATSFTDFERNLMLQ